MKLTTIRKNSEYSLGVVTQRGVLDVGAAAKYFQNSAPTTMEALIAGRSKGRDEIEGLLHMAELQDAPLVYLQEDEIQYGPCVTSPEKILCVGLNYRRHAEESGMQIPSTPILFSKFNNALAAHRDVIHVPSTTEQMDYEVELVIVMGKTARNVPQSDALSYVFGYTVGNDLSARDLQMKTSQWLLGKSMDGFAPMGPYLVTADEVSNPDALELDCHVNGELRQKSTTADMIFDCAYLIHYLSQHMTLKPGDVIFTGTPEGVILGYPKENQQWLQPGDEVVTSITGLGELRVFLQ